VTFFYPLPPYLRTVLYHNCVPLTFRFVGVYFMPLSGF
jgi:hypothetical protein